METTVVSSEFDIFAPRPVQSAVLETTEVPHKPVVGVDESDLEFLVSADDTYIDTNIKLFVRGKLKKANGADLDETDFTGVTNNLLHSLFSQCTVAVNSETVTPATNYNFRAFDTILTNGSDAAVS